ncbi:Heavy metal-associated isoprenylated plant protein 8 [Linum grandiflorum]
MAKGGDVIFKALIHCEGCVTQINKCLTGFGGVEDVLIEENGIVVANGNNLDPLKLLARLQSKYSRNVELISPIPKPKPPVQDKKEPPSKPEPKLKTLLLKVLMFCQGCADDIERTVGKMQGVVSVEAEMNSSTVVVIGFFDPERLVEKVRKQLGKKVEVLKLILQEESKGKGKDAEAKVEKPPPSAPAVPDDHYVCFCTAHPHRPFLDRGSEGGIHPSLVFNDDNVFACSIM